jgi:hypothetical protein
MKLNSPKNPPVNIVQFKSSFEVFYLEYSKGHKLIPLVHFNSVIDSLGAELINRGELETVSLIKNLRVSVYQFIAGEDVTPLSFRKTFKSTGLSRILGSEINNSIRHKSNTTIRLLLTVFQISYLVKGLNEPSLESIIDPSQADPIVLSDIGSWIESNYKRFFKVKPKTYWNDPHVSTKAGPLGAASFTNVNELALLTPGQINDVKLLGGPRFALWLDELLSIQDFLIRDQTRMNGGIPLIIKRNHLRRLTYVGQPEGKARVIAIFDYWSQTVLKEIHNWSFDQLRDLKNDATFNQSVFKKVLPKEGPYFSFDLSKATDRFPIALQERFLSCILGKERASAWKRIMIDTPFEVSWTGGLSTYGSGQPMGAYSSWSIFSLCHHLLVHYCANKVGISDFTAFIILGDDIVIANESVANEYKSVILSLGVQIDIRKSMVSKDTYEFAKRIFKQGEEITAFPLSAMIENSMSISALWSTTIVSRERGFVIDPMRIPGFVKGIQLANNIVFRQTEKQAKNLETLYTLTSDVDQNDYTWALLHTYRTIFGSVPCNMNLYGVESFLFNTLGYMTVKYNLSLLEDQYQRYYRLINNLTDNIHEYNPSKGTAPKAEAIPIDPMRIPITWIAKQAMQFQRKQVDEIKGLLSERAFGVLLRRGVLPVGDLNLVISRGVNKKQLAFTNKRLRFFKSETLKMNKLFSLEDGD